MAESPPFAGSGALLSNGGVLAGRYEVIGQLGLGGMGAVYLARDRELFGRLCVVKQMHASFASQSEWRKAEEDFQREAAVLARLNQPGHPHIPEVYAYFVERGDRFLVMKYIEGESLEGRLVRLKRPLAEAEVVRCAIEVADALVYLHSRKPEPVVHRDIKPANIILDPEDRIWLVDFGLARAVTRTGARVMVAGGKTVAAGTPGYTPLEQWQMQASPKSDVYALGATMHHLLTNGDPRDRFSSYAELDLDVLRSLSRFPLLAEARPDINPALAALVTRCLDADPRVRPTAQELKIELGRLSPTGSRFFETVKRWSPTLGELIGAAAASFVRMLFGRPARPRSNPSPSPTPSSPPSGRRARFEMPCLFCNGQGVTRDGKNCPVCRGSGYWWQE
jgi:serine/threonine protein kinase